ncbi:hypothetical protein [uncultured Umboniibacter sp.]|uniref:hypothetical protein n=1 Tax=uncultured Umboniibacter sp. TaxID=1798917 RepID=UPI00262E8EE1|nr:hypothetical protein [uncultured Umboniibacter sp.]
MSYWLLSVSDAVPFQRYKSRLADLFSGYPTVEFAAVDNAEELLRRLSSEEASSEGVTDVFLFTDAVLEKDVGKNACAGQLNSLKLIDLSSVVSPEASRSPINEDHLNDQLQSLRSQYEGAADVVFSTSLECKIAERMDLDFTGQSTSSKQDDLLSLLAEQIFELYCKSGAFDEILAVSLSKLFKAVAQYEAEVSEKLASLTVGLEHKSLMLDQKREEIARYNASFEGAAMVAQDKELLVLQVEQLESELEESYRQVESAKDRAGSIATLSAENRGLCEQVRQLEESKVEAESEINTLKTLAEGLTKRFDEADAELTALQDKYGPIKNYCDEMESQLTEYERSMDAQVKRYEDKIASLNSANQTLAERLSSAEVSMFERVSDADSEKSELLAVNQVFQSQTEIFRSEVKTLLKEKEMVNGMAGTTRIEDVFAKVKMSGLAIIGSYSEDGYQDIKLTCANVELGDQRFFKKLSFKLSLKNGHPGLEFRPDEVNPDCLDWLDVCNDEYGYFIPYFPNAMDLIDDRHLQVVESMNSSDRMLVVGIASTIAQALQSADLDDRTGLSSAELRQWRLAALKLKDLLEYESHWTSHGAVYLEEMFSVPGYQHLWLSLDHLLQGRRYFSKFDYKLSVNVSADEALVNSFSLELRQLISGDAPLLAWPTDSSDDAGTLLRVGVVVEDGVARVDVRDELTEEDKELIEALVKNSRYFIENLGGQGVELGRSVSEWNSVIGAFDSVVWMPADTVTEPLSVQDDMSDQYLTEVVVEDREVTEESESDAILSLNEVYEVEGYSHIAFSVAHRDRGELVAKYQLKFSEEDADGWVELRSAEGGARGLPFDHAIDVADDEYGEFISLRYEDLHQSEFTDKVCREASEADVSLLNAIKQKAKTLNECAELDKSAMWTAKFW